MHSGDTEVRALQSQRHGNSGTRHKRAQKEQMADKMHKSGRAATTQFHNFKEATSFRDGKCQLHKCV